MYFPIIRENDMKKISSHEVDCNDREVIFDWIDKGAAYTFDFKFSDIVNKMNLKYGLNLDIILLDTKFEMLLEGKVVDKNRENILIFKENVLKRSELLNELRTSNLKNLEDQKKSFRKFKIGFKNDPRVIKSTK